MCFPLMEPLVCDSLKSTELKSNIEKQKVFL